MKPINQRYEMGVLLLTLLTAMLLILPLNLLASEQKNRADAAQILTNQITGSANNMELSQLAQPLSGLSAGYESALKKTLTSLALKAKIERTIKENSRPEVLVPAFTKELRRAAREKKAQPSEVLAPYRAARVELAGGISGLVTVAGAPAANDVTVLAFDEYGYFAGDGKAVRGDGHYTISGLKSGAFYVITFSQEYVDEIYNNLAAPLASLEAWRNATKVAVVEGTVTGDINFDLQAGARIMGTLFHEDGTTPFANEDAIFIVTKKDAPALLQQTSLQLTDGRYELIVPAMGDIKLAATVNGYLTSWYPNQTEWALAQIVNIPSYDATVSNINVTLKADPIAETFGTITGTMRPEGQFFPSYLGLTLAFNAADTSFAGLGIVLLGNYTIEDLPAGQYFVYGNDVAGDLMGTGNYLPEFYQDAHSPDGAVPVTVEAQQETADINFVLDKGGSVSGKITDPQGNPLDSLMVLAVKSVVLKEGVDPFLTNLHLAACFTDVQGKYKMEGLPAGNYILRTLSDFIVTLNLAELDSIVKPGKHAGKVVDEYYHGVPNLLQIKNATPVAVTVPNETQNIDFQLMPAGFITGKLTDAVTGLPVTRVVVVALNDTSGYPYIPNASIDSVGQYRLGPLPMGKFKVLAVSGFERNVTYLSEFYNGKRDFASADVVTLSGTELPNIDFTLDKGATIRGFIDLSAGGGQYHAGADTLAGFPVVAYEATTGKVASYTFVQFAGGYRIEKLLPGAYKVMAMPVNPPFASTYWGGGNDFSDPAGQTVPLNFGQTADCNIELEQAAGTITGKVLHGISGLPLSQIMVVAYDASGHPVGLGMTDTDLGSDLSLTNDGTFSIHGLRTGQYYLRTLALSSAIQTVDQIQQLIGSFSGGFDLTQLLGGGLPSFDIIFTAFKDLWYPAVPATISYNLNELLFQASSFGLANEHDNSLFPIYVPVPFYDPIPTGAVALNVTSGSVTGGVEFRLFPGGLGDLFTGVDELAGAGRALPDKFAVSQNYPNPFNPSTALSVYLPSHAQVLVRIYDALGRQVKTLANGSMTAGEHKLGWDATDDSGNQVPAGIYLARVEAQGLTKTVKMLLVK